MSRGGPQSAIIGSIHLPNTTPSTDNIAYFFSAVSTIFHQMVAMGFGLFLVKMSVVVFLPDNLRWWPDAARMALRQTRSNRR